MKTLETGFYAPANDLERQISRLGPWFHNIHLSDGTQTAPNHPLGDFPAFKWKIIEPFIEQDLSGKRALDIGCNAGFYSFELAKRGARVLGIDSSQRYLAQGRWCCEQLGLEDRVEFRRMGVYQLNDLNMRFDFVLFMGVFYHLRYPLLGLDIAARKTTGTMIFQTMTTPGEQIKPFADDVGIYDRQVMNDPAWPRMAFIEKRLQGDPTNWWVANRSGAEAMLRSTGFGSIHYIASEIWICREPTADGVSDLREIFR